MSHLFSRSTVLILGSPLGLIAAVATVSAGGRPMGMRGGAMRMNMPRLMSPRGIRLLCPPLTSPPCFHGGTEE